MERILRILRPAFGRAYVRIKGGNRERSWILWEIILPLIMMSSVIIAYQNLGAPKFFIGFVIIGSAMMSYWYNVLWGMGSVIYWEKESGNLEVFLLSHSSISSLLLGMALGGMFNTSIRSISLILVGTFIFHAEFNLKLIPLATVVFLLTLAALYGMGLAFSSLYLIYGRKGMRINEALDQPIMFLSGQYYPINIFPSFLQFIAGLIPLTIGLDGIRRALILNEGLSQLYFHIIILSAMALIFYPAGVGFLNRIVEKGRRDGRLILRWI